MIRTTVTGLIGPIFVSYLLYAFLFTTVPNTVAAVSPNQNLKGWGLTENERHCMVVTIMGEATPNNKQEVIAIARNILRRKEMRRWGSSICSVTLAPKQYSVWNNKRMPSKKRVGGSKQYKQYNAWVSEALSRGPMRHDHYWHPKTMKALYGYSNPRWARNCIVKERIGHATFCTLGKSKRLSQRNRRRHA
jgi:spore germination cell wall hydrolase CwlJ-like protein